MKKYSKYKDSGIEWIGEIPNSWEIKRARFLFEILPSNIDKKSKDDEKEVKLCNYVDVYKNDFITQDFDFMIATASDSQIEKFTLQKFDVIATKDSEDPNDIGVPALVVENLKNIVCGYHLTLFRSFENREYSRYLFWFLKSKMCAQYFSTLARGVTRYALGTSVFKNLPLPYIKDISELESISNFLDKTTFEIEKLISNKQRLIELLKEERIAIISHTITKGINSNVKLKDSEVDWIGNIPKHWEIKRVRFLFEIQKKIAGKLGYDILSVTQRGIKIKDIKSGDGQLSMDYSKYQIVNKGEFVMNHMDLLTGYVDISKYNGVTSPDYRVFSLEDSNSIAEYFLYHFQNCYHNKIFFPLGQGSAQAGRWRLPTKNFNDFSFPVPPKSEQIEICDFLKSSIEKNELSIFKIEKEIELLNEYKMSMINEVVTGKVDVREEVLA